MSNGNFHMSAYMCFLKKENIAAGISDCILAELNQYYSVSRKNVEHVWYVKDVTEDLENDDRHALDYWLVTMDVVSAIGSLYEDDIRYECLYQYIGLVGFRFEINENICDVRGTMAIHIFNDLCLCITLAYNC